MRLSEFRKPQQNKTYQPRLHNLLTGNTGLKYHFGNFTTSDHFYLTLKNLHLKLVTTIALLINEIITDPLREQVISGSVFLLSQGITNVTAR